MKKVKPIEFMQVFIPVLIVIGAVLIGLFSGCKSNASCDAYGHNNIEYGDISENEKS